jgi:signal transduction histidine kinase
MAPRGPDAPLPEGEEADQVVALTTPLATGGPGQAVRDALRKALADPDLDIVYPRVGSGGWINDLGEGAGPAVRSSRAFTAIDRGGRPVAGLVHDPALLDDPERLHAATEAVSLAIENERLKAQLRAELAEVQASRARLVDAGDRERKRVERNLHDGAQQRLVGLALMLRLVARSAEGDDAMTALLADAVRELEDALAELRELARGIHPAVVDDAGLTGALETLVERSRVPVRLAVDVPAELPAPVQVGVYYLVAEALTNVDKHAGARGATVQAKVVDGSLHVSVADDGPGGARAVAGGGLQGLADRMSALGGQLEVASSPDQGTTVATRLPLVAPSEIVDERRRMTALRWIGWESWKGPAELYDQITHEDNLTFGKATLLCAGGNAQLTEREREWLEGYLTAAGDAEWVIEAVRTYDDSDSLEDIMQVPGMAATARAPLYVAMRACASDGPLTPAELDRLRRGGAAMGVAPEVIRDLEEIVAAEQALQDRRYELIAAPALLPVARPIPPG